MLTYLAALLAAAGPQAAATERQTPPAVAAGQGNAAMAERVKR